MPLWHSGLEGVDSNMGLGRGDSSRFMANDQLSVPRRWARTHGATFYRDREVRHASGGFLGYKQLSMYLHLSFKSPGRVRTHPAGLVSLARSNRLMKESLLEPTAAD